MDFRTRPFEDNDIEMLLPVLLKTWTYGNLFSLEKRRKATELFLYRCLSMSDYRSVLLSSNHVKGILLASTHPDYKDGYYDFLFEKVSNEYRKDKEIDELAFYNDIVFFSNKTLKEKEREDYQEIILLVLDTDLQGKGCGKMLINEFHSIRDRKRPILLTSDEDCNYPFYEHLGYHIKTECSLPYKFNKRKEILHSYLFYLK